ncbi:MAG TPA: phospholipase D-like domain-containing protein [Thermoanaerobaculia bacterium]|nr:phospholipase D-like domain-containing protein [Thermoanaerobaculia bacterium]
MEERVLLPMLRPPAGRQLPRWLRPWAVHRRAARLAAGTADPRFGQLLARISDDRVFRSEGLRIDTEGYRAFRAMVEAVRGARDEVLLETYIFHDDEVGREMADELVAAAARGATVRLLVDGVGSLGAPLAFWRGLEERGVATAVFRPLPPRGRLSLVRDHRKILVVDRRVAFTGGMNVGAEYGSAHWARGATNLPGGGPWRDTNVRVTGGAAWELALVFAEGWKIATGERLALGTWRQQPVRPGDEGIVVLDSRPGRGAGEAEAVLAGVLGGARERLWVTNSYFAPKHIVRHALKRAARRGVDVRLLLPGESDLPVVLHAGHGEYAGLMAAGVRIWEYQPSILHAKTLVADGRVSLIGSSNLDFRSFHFNGEVNLVVLGEATGAEMERLFEHDLEVSRPVDPAAWRRRGLLHKAGDRAARILSPLL